MLVPLATRPAQAAQARHGRHAGNTLAVMRWLVRAPWPAASSIQIAYACRSHLLPGCLRVLTGCTAKA